MKKYILPIVTTLIVLVMLTGCGNQNKTSGVKNTDYKQTSYDENGGNQGGGWGSRWGFWHHNNNYGYSPGNNTQNVTPPDTSGQPSTPGQSDTQPPVTNNNNGVTPNKTNNTTPNQTNNTAQNQTNASLSDFQQKVVDLTNQQRKNNGLPALKVDTKLANVAETKAKDMANNNYFSHTSPTYGSPFQMMQKFGIQYTTAEENIAAGQQTPQDVVNAWMKSPGHRANILNKKVNYIGVGYAKGGSMGTYWTQEFIQK